MFFYMIFSEDKFQRITPEHPYNTPFTSKKDNIKLSYRQVTDALNHAKILSLPVNNNNI